MRTQANPQEIERLAAAARHEKHLLDIFKRTHASEDIRRRTAEEYIKRHYAWQTAKFGRVQKQLSVSKLLR